MRSAFLGFAQPPGDQGNLVLEETFHPRFDVHIIRIFTDHTRSKHMKLFKSNVSLIVISKDNYYHGDFVLICSITLCKIIYHTIVLGRPRNFHREPFSMRLAGCQCTFHCLMESDMSYELGLCVPSKVTLVSIIQISFSPKATCLF